MKTRLHRRGWHSAIVALTLAYLAGVSLVGCRDNVRPAPSATSASAPTTEPALAPRKVGMLPSVRLFLGREDFGIRWLAISYLAGTPQGHAFFKACLGSPDRATRLLGLEGYRPGRFSEISTIAGAATAGDSGASEIFYGTSDIRAVLGTAPYYGPSIAASKREIASRKSRLLAWVKSHHYLWDNESYVKYWKGMFRRAVSRWNETNRFDSGSAADLADGVLLSWGQLLSTHTNPRRNIDAALKLLPPFLTLDVPTGGSGVTSPAAIAGLRNRLYAGMVWQMQLIVGPMLPESVHINGENWRTNLAAFRKWWSVHRSERRSQWLLAGLATKGYRTEHPNNVRRTVKALIMALRSHAHGGLDRATAAEVLNMACPRMSALITPPPKMSPAPHRESSLEIAAMYHDSISAAIRWYFQYANRARWDRHTARYIILPKRKAVPWVPNAADGHFP